MLNLSMVCKPDIRVPSTCGWKGGDLFVFNYLMLSDGTDSGEDAVLLDTLSPYLHNALLP